MPETICEYFVFKSRWKDRTEHWQGSFKHSWTIIALCVPVRACERENVFIRHGEMVYCWCFETAKGSQVDLSGCLCTVSEMLTVVFRIFFRSVWLFALEKINDNVYKLGFQKTLVIYCHVSIFVWLPIQKVHFKLWFRRIVNINI